MPIYVGRVVLKRRRVSLEDAGLFIWAFLFVYGSFVWYAPHLIPGYAGHRIALNLTTDFLFIVSLFVLGGDFWEKFRALFSYDR